MCRRTFDIHPGLLEWLVVSFFIRSVRKLFVFPEYVFISSKSIELKILRPKDESFFSLPSFADSQSFGLGKISVIDGYGDFCIPSLCTTELRYHCPWIWAVRSTKSRRMVDRIVLHYFCMRSWLRWSSQLVPLTSVMATAIATFLFNLFGAFPGYNCHNRLNENTTIFQRIKCRKLLERNSLF